MGWWSAHWTQQSPPQSRGPWDEGLGTTEPPSHGPRSLYRQKTDCHTTSDFSYHPKADGAACMSLYSQRGQQGPGSHVLQPPSTHRLRRQGLGELGTEKSRSPTSSSPEQQAKGWTGFLGEGYTAAVTLKECPQPYLLWGMSLGHSNMTVTRALWSQAVPHPMPRTLCPAYFGM